MTTRVEFAYRLRDQAALNARMCRLLYGRFGRQGIIAAIVAVTLAGIPAAYLASLLAGAYQLPVFLALMLGWFLIAGRISQRISLGLARRVSQASSLDGAACAIEARPEHLLWTGPDWRTEVRWSGVDRIDDGPLAVMIVFRGTGYFAPCAAFADETARKAFIAECAKYMTPEARRKSGMA